MNRLSPDDLPQIRDDHRIYYRDIYDHLVRIHDLSEAIRDVVTGTLDTYLSATSNRLNEVMKALTIVSTIFLPLSFLAGVYGMNFDYLPELHWRYGYFLVWGTFIFIVAGMLWYFLRRGWNLKIKDPVFWCENGALKINVLQPGGLNVAVWEGASNHD